MSGETAEQFNAVSADPYAAFRSKIFPPAAADKVIDVLSALQLPVPEKSDEFLEASLGVLIFSNLLGVVIRIENAIEERVSDNPWIIQPLGSFRAGRTVAVEICPGCHGPAPGQDMAILVQKVARAGMLFWDKGSSNIGRLPLKSAAFPDGVPVIVDRPSVHAGYKKSVRRRREKDPQKKLYRPLREALRKAWPSRSTAPDVEKMKVFWRLCAEFTRQGKLVAGWQEDRKDTYKLNESRQAALNYDLKLKQKLS